MQTRKACSGSVFPRWHITMDHAYPPPLRRNLITLFSLTGTFMVQLDTTIANVAMPHMQASTSASREQITWVLTSYIIMSAICMPLTGWLAGRIGRKRLVLIAVIEEDDLGAKECPVRAGRAAGSGDDELRCRPQRLDDIGEQRGDGERERECSQDEFHVQPPRGCCARGVPAEIRNWAVCFHDRIPDTLRHPTFSLE